MGMNIYVFHTDRYVDIQTNIYLIMIYLKY